LPRRAPGLLLSNGCNLTGEKVHALGKKVPRDKLLNAGGTIIFAAASIIYARARGGRIFSARARRSQTRTESEVLVIAKPTSRSSRRFCAAPADLIFRVRPAAVLRLTLLAGRPPPREKDQPTGIIQFNSVLKQMLNCTNKRSPGENGWACAARQLICTFLPPAAIE
jgi:hypothetical protein